jgi:hypothetical protein
MKDFEEYVFRLPDGSLRYEFVDLNDSIDDQIEAFRTMHSAIEALPLEKFESL